MIGDLNFVYADINKCFPIRVHVLSLLYSLLFLLCCCCFLLLPVVAAAPQGDQIPTQSSEEQTTRRQFPKYCVIVCICLFKELRSTHLRYVLTFHRDMIKTNPNSQPVVGVSPLLPRCNHLGHMYLVSVNVVMYSSTPCKCSC